MSEELLSKGIEPGDWLGIQARIDLVDDDGDNFWIVKAVDAASTSVVYIYIARTSQTLN